MRVCDLHTHSTYSDGTFTPTQIVDEAVGMGLSAVALTDHNTVDGLREFTAAAQGLPVEAVAGAEFSVDYHGIELHLLGLFIKEPYFDEISRLMKYPDDEKEKSNRKLIASLNRAGYSVEYDTIKNTTPNGRFNRVHVAKELTRKGYTHSIDHAFATLLSEESGYYQKPKRLLFFDILSFLQSMGAVPVLAHPLLQLSAEELEQLLPTAKEKGLVGLECYYSEYDQEQMALSLSLAEKFGLQCSGGSDFHGKNKPHIQLGVGKGDLKVSYECYQNLKKIAE
jgi:predicted metal-dependent phosphoesterase TrpH